MLKICPTPILTLNLPDSVNKCKTDIQTHLLMQPCYLNFLICRFELFCQTVVTRDSNQSSSPLKYVSVLQELPNLCLTPGVCGWDERMDATQLSVSLRLELCPRKALISSAASYAFNSFFFQQETVWYSCYMIWLIFTHSMWIIK